ncbi:MAG TPA: hypothetical protein VKU80_15790 [Planctomycetota bacterium]|nr:hypothetical protein [Planctomycetota bacterium]
MALWDICAYKDVSTHITGLPALSGGGIYTGHHMIPDHCWYYTKGLRGKGDLSAFLCPTVHSYKDDDAPVIIVTADANGGKSRIHGVVHQFFDPVEDGKGSSWSYKEARLAAVSSVLSAQKAEGAKSPWSSANLIAKLDEYFVKVCGVNDATMIRAGEHNVFPNIEVRSSERNPKKAKLF